MFGLFGGDKGKIRKLRTTFDDIRQRVVYRMNSFEQYSFGSVFDHIPEELAEPFFTIAASDSASWLRLADTLETNARQGYREFERVGGLAGEGGRAGAEGLMLLSLEAAARAYASPEARLLLDDIVKFREFVNSFVTSPDYENQPLSI